MPTEVGTIFARIWEPTGSSRWSELPLLEDDIVSRIASRIEQTFKLPGLAPGQLDLFLVPADGDDEPTLEQEIAATRSGRLQVSWKLGRAGIKPGCWVLAMPTFSGSVAVPAAAALAAPWGSASAPVLSSIPATSAASVFATTSAGGGVGASGTAPYAAAAAALTGGLAGLASGLPPIPSSALAYPAAGDILPPSAAALAAAVTSAAGAAAASGADLGVVSLVGEPSSPAQRGLRGSSSSSSVGGGLNGLEDAAEQMLVSGSPLAAAGTAATTVLPTPAAAPLAAEGNALPSSTALLRSASVPSSSSSAAAANVSNDSLVNSVAVTNVVGSSFAKRTIVTIPVEVSTGYPSDFAASSASGGDSSNSGQVPVIEAEEESSYDGTFASTSAVPTPASAPARRSAGAASAAGVSSSVSSSVGGRQGKGRGSSGNSGAKSLGSAPAKRTGAGKLALAAPAAPSEPQVIDYDADLLRQQQAQTQAAAAATAAADYDYNMAGGVDEEGEEEEEAIFDNSDDEEGASALRGNKRSSAAPSSKDWKTVRSRPAAASDEAGGLGSKVEARAKGRGRRVSGEEEAVDAVSDAAPKGAKKRRSSSSADKSEAGSKRKRPASSSSADSSAEADTGNKKHKATAASSSSSAASSPVKARLTSSVPAAAASATKAAKRGSSNSVAAPDGLPRYPQGKIIRRACSSLLASSVYELTPMGGSGSAYKARNNEGYCDVCRGDDEAAPLLGCDYCPRSFHHACVGKAEGWILPEDRYACCVCADFYDGPRAPIQFPTPCEVKATLEEKELRAFVRRRYIASRSREQNPRVAAEHPCFGRHGVEVDFDTGLFEVRRQPMQS